MSAGRSGPTYEPVGCTEAVLAGGPSPAGMRSLHVVRALRAVAFEEAAHRLLRWQVHEAAGVRVHRPADPVVLGQHVTTLLGVGRLALAAPCEVVRVWDGPDLAGFAYGTLPGHPFAGEEAFVVRRTADGVRFEVVAASRPATWWSALAGPVAPLLQGAYARRLARAADRA
ncbi:DUF1990 family protein [Aquipuribacter sp. SD81]|uniref:DUF1990 family protein n=1 Tax=Aquipuribacter sp. SD81 TaxID=3127703 RepID=UPI00301616A6